MPTPASRAIKEIVAVSGSIPATPNINTIGTNLNSLQSVAVEGSGDLIVTTAVSSNTTVAKFFLSSGYATSTVLSNNFNAPTGVAVTAGGDLYVVDSNSASGASLFEIPRAAVPAINFKTPTAPGETDTADSPQIVVIENIGNLPMAISSLTFSQQQLLIRHRHHYLQLVRVACSGRQLRAWNSVHPGNYRLSHQWNARRCRQHGQRRWFLPEDHP